MNDLDLNISMVELDKHLLEQTSLFGMIAEKYAEAVNARDFLKSDVEILEAEIDIQIREDAKKNNEKITEKVVASKVILDSSRIDLTNELLSAQAAVNNFAAQKQTLECRKKSLEGLIQLYIADWFSEINAKISPEKAQEFRDTKADVEQRENVANLKRRKRNG